VDYLSGFFEVDRLPSKRTSDIVYVLKQRFVRHGLPVELLSDNSPFNSSELARYTSVLLVSSYYFVVQVPPVERSGGKRCANSEKNYD